jgi:Tetratricopeptide repeat
MGSGGHAKRDGAGGAHPGQARCHRPGPDHPDTAWSLDNLARALADQGDLAAARALFERALHIARPAWAPSTPTHSVAGGILQRSSRRWRIACSRLTLYVAVVAFWRHPWTLAWAREISLETT